MRRQPRGGFGRAAIAIAIAGGPAGGGTGTADGGGVGERNERHRASSTGASSGGNAAKQQRYRQDGGDRPSGTLEGTHDVLKMSGTAAAAQTIPKFWGITRPGRGKDTETKLDGEAHKRPVSPHYFIKTGQPEKNKAHVNNGAGESSCIRILV